MIQIISIQPFSLWDWLPACESHVRRVRNIRDQPPRVRPPLAPDDVRSCSASAGIP
jgi:hypothetical protein